LGCRSNINDKKNINTLTQEEQYNNLKAHYGFSLNFVEVTLPLTMNEMIDIYGEPCTDYEPRCVLCKAWEQWKSNNYRVTVIISREAVIKAAKEDCV